MAILGGSGISVTDVSDALVTTDGLPPRGASNGTLWLDGKTLKKYENGNWVIQEIDVTQLDPDLAKKIEGIMDNIGTIGDDSKLTFNDRSILARELGEIIGVIPSKTTGNVYPSSLPAYNVLDSSGSGTFSNVRARAVTVGMDVNDSRYKAIETAYTSLNSYLSQYTPKAWDITTANKDKIVTLTDPDMFRQKFLDYYTAELKLATEVERVAKESAEDYADTITDGVSLKDKTEILSGNPVFTDKADDNSVVHVDVDGKSVGGGNGKNLFPSVLPIYGFYHSSAGTEVAEATSSLIRAYIPIDSTLTYSWNNNISKRIIIMTYDLNKKPLERITTYSSPYISSKQFDSNVKYVSFSSYQSSYDFSDFQFEVGSVQTSYEPPAPSPDYPIAINSLNNIDVVSSVGKENLLLDSHFDNGNDGWLTANAPAIRGESQLRIDGTGNLSTRFQYSDTFKVGWHTITIKYKSNTALQFRSFVNTHDVSESADISSEWAIKIVPFFVTSSEEPTIIRIYLSDGAVGKSASLDWVKIEEGDSATDYSTSIKEIQYDTPTPTIYKTNISLPEPLRSVGDVKDRLFRDTDGLWKVERNVGERIFNGSEPWSMGASSGGWYTSGSTLPFYQYNLNGLKKASTESLTSHFKTYVGSGLVGADVEGFSVSHTSYEIFRISSSRLTAGNPDAFKLWLSNNPVTVHYVLNTPTIETLPDDIQQKLNNIQSYKGNNYVYTVLPDKSDNSPYVAEQLKPTLHATFKSRGWYRDFRNEAWKIESEKALEILDKEIDDVGKVAQALKNFTDTAFADGIIQMAEAQSISEHLNTLKKENDDLSNQYTTIYSNTNLLGTPKSNLASAKTAYNTAYTNLTNSVNTAISGNKTTTTQKADVDNKFTAYSNALKMLTQRLNEALSSIADKIATDIATAKANEAKESAEDYADTITDGVSLKDKTDILSGNPVFTDKADDNSVVHVDVDGKSVGGGTKNLFNLSWYVALEKDRFSSGTYSLSSDGGMVVNRADSRGTAKSEYSYYIPVKPSTTYTFSTDQSMNWRINEHNASGALVINQGQGGGNSITFTTSSSTVVLTTKFYPASTAYPVTVRKIQLEEGSTVTPYEPEAIPTPDYPIAINSLNNVDVVSSVGKENLLTGTTSEWRSNSVSNGGYASFHHGLIKFSDVGLKEGDMVTFSLVLKTNSSYGVKARFEQFLDNDRRIMEVSDAVYAESDLASVTVTIKHPYNQFRVGVQAGQAPAPEQIDYEYRLEKLEINGVNTLYSPSPEDIQPDTPNTTAHKTNISLPEPLRSVGDVKDRLFRDTDGLWKVERNVGERIFTGQEVWGTYASQKTYTYNLYEAKRGYQTSITSHFINKNGAWNLTSFGVGDYSDHTTVDLRYFNSDKATVTDFKTWLSEEYSKGTPLTITFVLATPTIETLPDDIQQKLSNIQSYGATSGNVFSMKEEYYVSTSFQGFRMKLKPNRAYVMTTNIPDSSGINFNTFFSSGRVAPSHILNGVSENFPRTVYTDSTGEVSVAVRVGTMRVGLDNGTYWIRIQEVPITNYVYTVLPDKSDILSPTLHATFKSKGWTDKNKTEEKINNSTRLPVRYIRDWSAGSDINTYAHWVEIQAIQNGINVAKGATVTPSTPFSAGNGSTIVDGNTTSGSYVQINNQTEVVPDPSTGGTKTVVTPNNVIVDLGKVYNDLESIKVWHFYSDERTYNNTLTEVSVDGENWTALYDSEIMGVYPETSQGRTYSVITNQLASNAIQHTTNLVSRVNNVEQQITADSIVSTVMAQEKFTSWQEVVDAKPTPEAFDLLSGNLSSTTDAVATIETRVTEVEQTATSWGVTLDEQQEIINEHGTTVSDITTYMTFKDTGLEIGKSDSNMKVNISNTQIDFMDNGTAVAWINGQQLYIRNAQVLNTLVVGNHKFEKLGTDMTVVNWFGG